MKTINKILLGIVIAMLIVGIILFFIWIFWLSVDVLTFFIGNQGIAIAIVIVITVILCCCCGRGGASYSESKG